MNHFLLPQDIQRFRAPTHSPLMTPNFQIQVPTGIRLRRIVNRWSLYGLIGEAAYRLAQVVQTVVAMSGIGPVSCNILALDGPAQVDADDPQTVQLVKPVKFGQPC